MHHDAGSFEVLSGDVSNGVVFDGILDVDCSSTMNLAGVSFNTVCPVQVVVSNIVREVLSEEGFLDQSNVHVTRGHEVSEFMELVMEAVGIPVHDFQRRGGTTHEQR